MHVSTIPFPGLQNFQYFSWRPKDSQVFEQQYRRRKKIDCSRVASIGHKGVNGFAFERSLCKDVDLKLFNLC